MFLPWLFFVVSAGAIVFDRDETLRRYGDQIAELTGLGRSVDRCRVDGDHLPGGTTVQAD